MRKISPYGVINTKDKGVTFYESFNNLLYSSDFNTSY